MRNTITGWRRLAAAACGMAIPFLAAAHPSIEGGLKQGAFVAKNAEGKGVMGGHIELVADPQANEIRVYLSHSTDEKMGEGAKYHEWVQNLAVRNKVISTPQGRREVALLPVPSPGAGAEWFPVAPAETEGGYLYYWIDLAAKVVLDGDPANPRALTFSAATDPKGRQCLRANLKLDGAKTIRIQEVSLAVQDPSGAKAAWQKKYYEKTAWGLGQLWKDVPSHDVPLQKFAEFIAKSETMDKHRKPEAPARASR